MAITKSRAAITQLTASGTSTTMDVSTKLGLTCSLKHSNGAGAVSAAATFNVQCQYSGGTLWHSLTSGPAAFGTTTGSTDDDRTIPIPEGAVSVRVVYVAPTGPAGFSLDAECGMASF